MAMQRIQKILKTFWKNSCVIKGTGVLWSVFKDFFDLIWFIPDNNISSRINMLLKREHLSPTWSKILTDRQKTSNIKWKNTISQTKIASVQSKSYKYIHTNTQRQTKNWLH